MNGVIAKLFLLIFLLSSPIFAFTIYEDKNSNIAPQEIFNYEYKFYTPSQDSFSYSDSTFWLKFDFSNEPDLASVKYILFNFAILNYVDMFYENNASLKEFNHGAGAKKEFPFNEVAFTLPLDEIDNRIVYIRIKHNGILSLENKIFDSKDELFKLLVLRSDTTILMVGVSALLIFFISILAYYLKEYAYRFYLMFLVLITMVHLSINNSLGWFFPLDGIDLILQMLVDLAVVSIYLFIMNITKMKIKFPNIFKVFKLVISIALYILVAELFNIREIYLLKNIIAVPIFIAILSVSVLYMLYKRAEYSIFIFIAVLFLVISSLTLLLSKHGVITGMYSPVVWKLSIIMSMITFSLLLLYRIKELADDKIKSELVLEEQSKLAVIGETLTNIEHQWRSPLSKISSNIIALETELEVKGKVENKSLKKSLLSMTDTLDYMTNLVDYFKVFYMKDQEKKPFLIGNAYLRVSRLLEYDFLKYKINVTYIDEDKLQIYGHLNEFTQVILNILSNSRDIFIQREIENPEIKIVVKKKNNSVIISIEDNAGGIEDSSIEDIFNQFFSDKEKQSTGVGLYLCKHIVERKMGGTITVQNSSLGAKFIIKI